MELRVSETNSSKSWLSCWIDIKNQYEKYEERIT